MQATKIGQQNSVQVVLNEKVGGEQGVAGFLSGALGLAKELQSSKVAVSLVGLPGPRGFLENLREGLIGQASTSRDVSLLAVNHLLERDGKPANGGLEIPWTGKGVGGARTKSRAAVESQIADLKEKLAQLRMAFSSKGREIRELAEDMVQEESDSPEYAALEKQMKTHNKSAEDLNKKIALLEATIEALDRSMA